MTEPLVIGCHGCNWVPDSNTKMISLFCPTYQGTNSMHDDSDTDYQVPVGKKLIILEIQADGSNGSSYTYSDYTPSIATISKSLVTDTVGTTITQIQGGERQTNNVYGLTSLPPCPVNNVYFEISASNYIVVNNSTGTTKGIRIRLTGIETDV